MRARLLPVVILITLLFSVSLDAASTYADPAFQTQWQAGEAITANFWGPLANAKDGQQEPYKEAQGGQRLVQYFDKGRMELTNGTVTNGLLATELVKGQIQVGDATFQPQPPPAIAIAGDPSTTGATYAALGTTASGLLAPAAAKVGQVINTTIMDSGALGSVAIPPIPATTITLFDASTQHNVPGAFATYREKAGLLTIGYAISEPFHANVNVGGAPRFVMIQVFERRVLTYTDTNPDAFKVEMGNIGQHYYQWRYPTGLPLTTPTPPTTTAPAAPSLSVAPASAPLGSTFQVTGAGLPPNTSYVLLLVRSDGSIWGGGDVMTSATGTLAASIDTSALPKLTPGDYTAQLQVQRAPTRVGAAAFTIT